MERNSGSFRRHAGLTLSARSAYLLDPTYVTEVVKRWVDVDLTWGLCYGRTLGYTAPPPAGSLQQARVVRRFDNERFYRLYVDLMTRPLPVR